MAPNAYDNNNIKLVQKLIKFGDIHSVNSSFYFHFIADYSSSQVKSAPVLHLFKCMNVLTEEIRYHTVNTSLAPDEELKGKGKGKSCTHRSSVEECS